MKKYAILENMKVINIILAESKEEAESVTGLEAIETDKEPWLGWTLENNTWVPPAPFSFWTWDGNQWNPPELDKNNDSAWIWNEESQTWEETPKMI